MTAVGTKLPIPNVRAVANGGKADKICGHRLCTFPGSASLRLVIEEYSLSSDTHLEDGRAAPITSAGRFSPRGAFGHAESM